jgi:cysteine-rich repeat protein
VCRAATGECDVAETCTGSTTACPADAFAPAETSCTDDGNVCTRDVCGGGGATCQHPAGNAGAVCRAAAGACDVAEVCDGVASTCPADGKSTTVCRPAAGPCDVPESCDGTSDGCPVDAFVPSATVCRPSAGECDVAETCTGSSAACPADALVAAGTPCTDDGNVCTRDVCGSASAGCQHPAGNAGTVCRAAAGVCDVAEVCDGVASTCPANAFAPSTVACRPAAGPCDVAETCTGAGAACPTDAKSTAVCRPAASECDVAERCDGVGNTCPVNAFQADGTTCSGNPCTHPKCQAGTCVAGPSTPVCGDGVVCGTEACDDGNLIDGDGCDRNCTPTHCGNGILTVGEVCDDGNQVGGDGCKAGCSFELIPGNGTGGTNTDARACLLEWSVVNPHNSPYLDSRGRPIDTQRCVDNDPTCDRESAVGVCQFQVVVCLNNVDPNLANCPARGVASPVTVTKPTQANDPVTYAALTAAFQTLRNPATGATGLHPPVAATSTNLCSAPFAVRVPLAGPSRQGSLQLCTSSTSLTPAGTTDTDCITLVCKP